MSSKRRAFSRCRYKGIHSLHLWPSSQLKVQCHVSAKAKTRDMIISSLTQKQFLQTAKSEPLLSDIKRSVWSCVQFIWYIVWSRNLAVEHLGLAVTIPASHFGIPDFESRSINRIFWMKRVMFILSHSRPYTFIPHLFKFIIQSPFKYTA
jgi:hypothetical protein